MTTDLQAIIDRHPALAALREALAAEIGTPNSTVATREALNALTIVTARCYSLVCKGDERYHILSPAMHRLWAGGEKLVCAEATAAATVTSNHALSDAGRNSAAIDVAGCPSSFSANQGTQWRVSACCVGAAASSRRTR
jgi:sarcosine oxidase gamma subunit